MDLRQLRCFVAVYETGSFSGASERINIVVSAVSHHINGLEGELKTVLFERAKTGMTPTASAHRLYDHARAITRSVEEAAKDVQSLSGEVAGACTISMSYTAMKVIGAPLAEQVLTKHPGVKLRLLESLSGLTVDDLRTRNVDMALAYNPKSRASIVMTPLLQEELGCIATADFFQNDAETITFNSALSYPLVLVGVGPSSRILFERGDILRKAISASLLQTDSPTMAVALARTGRYCTFGPNSLLDNKDGQLQFRRVTHPAVKRALYLCEDGDRPKSILQETIRKLIIELVDAKIREKAWSAASLIN